MEKVPANSSLWITHELSDVIWENSSVDFTQRLHTFNFSVVTSSSSLIFNGNGSLSFTVSDVKAEFI
jgi:hypothetical protein